LLIFKVDFWGFAHAGGPGITPGSRFPVLGAGRPGSSGQGGECAEFGEDLGEQPAAGLEPEGHNPGVVYEAAGDTDEPVSEGGDHGFAVTDPVPSNDVFAMGGGCELV
jgi:hypothetical protein